MQVHLPFVWHLGIKQKMKNIGWVYNLMFPSLSRDNASTLQYVKDHKPLIEGQQIRILLYGPVGAGKSSFINAVQSVLRGKMYKQALAANNSHGSFTKEVRRIFDFAFSVNKLWPLYCLSTNSCADWTTRLLKKEGLKKVVLISECAANARQTYHRILIICHDSINSICWLWNVKKKIYIKTNQWQSPYFTVSLYFVRAPPSDPLTANGK